MKRIATALTCAAALALCLGAPAHADSGAVRAGTADYLLQVVSHSGAPDGKVSQVRWAVLDCDPVGGSHPRAEEACDLIAEHGDVAGVSVGWNSACTMDYRPVTVRVTGAEQYEETFGNECAMKNTKGAVFDF